MPQVDLIFGLPTELEEDQRMTLDLVRWIVAKGGKVRAHRFMPLPGTPLAAARPRASGAGCGGASGQDGAGGTPDRKLVNVAIFG